MKRPIVIGAIACACALIVAWLAATVSSGRSPIRAYARVDHVNALVGDSVRYTLNIYARREITVEPPDIDAALKDFIIRDKKGVTRDEGARKIIVFTYVVTKDEPGKFAIAPLDIRYKKSEAALWDSIGVRGFDIVFNSVIGVDSDNAITTIKIGGEAPIKGFRRGEETRGEPMRVMEVEKLSSRNIMEASGPKDVLTVQDIIFMALSTAAGLIIMIFGVGYIYEKFIKKTPPPLLPHELALNGLNGLKTKKGAAPAGTKVVYSAVYSIMKDYLQARFGLARAERTVREFVAEVEKIKELPDSEKRATVELLRLCEVASYSEYTPRDSEAESAVASAKAIIEKTMPGAGERVNG